MSRFIKKIEVDNPVFQSNRAATFLLDNGFHLVNRNGEDTYMRTGFGCDHCVILSSDETTILLTAFIVYRKYVAKKGFFNQLGGVMENSGPEVESTMRGVLGGFGKWPLQRTVKKLIKLVKTV